MNSMKKVLAVLISSILGVSILAGCTVTIDPGKDADEKIDIRVVGEEDSAEAAEAEEDEEEVQAAEADEKEAETDETDEEEPEKITRSVVKSSKDNSFAVGTWYTEDYDEDENWALSYRIELTEDGKASVIGWRNKDAGTYEVKGDDTVVLTLDDCRTSSFHNDYKKEIAYSYSIEMKIDGDDAEIKVDAPEVISNLADGTVHRKKAASRMASSDEEGDEGEGVDIKDGTYLTDEEYKGELSSDGKTMTITTALNHEDKNWNLVQDYEKRTYVFTVSDKCKCVVLAEDREEGSFFDNLDLIGEFLEGKSGLPITLTIKNNEVTEILFTS